MSNWRQRTSFRTSCEILLSLLFEHDLWPKTSIFALKIATKTWHKQHAEDFQIAEDYGKNIHHCISHFQNKTSSAYKESDEQFGAILCWWRKMFFYGILFMKVNRELGSNRERQTYTQRQTHTHRYRDTYTNSHRPTPETRHTETDKERHTV